MLIKPVSLPQDLQLLEAPVTCIRRSVVHLLTARRNAWHNTTLNHYNTNAPTFTRAATARHSAEGRRKPGTYFVISEELSLAFDLATGLSVVVTHLNASPPFKSWSIPTALIARDAPLTGLEVFNMFVGSNYTEASSGWRVPSGEPDVILGIADGAALVDSSGRKQLQKEISSVEPGGRMIFDIASKARPNPTHLDRIVEELGHLNHPELHVGEIYRWGGEYFCENDVRKLYNTEPNRLIDYGFPVKLTAAPTPPTFCSVCFRWFSDTHPDGVG